MARRALAAPFVVTISLAALGACDSSKTEVADAKSKKADGKDSKDGKQAKDAKEGKDAKKPERVHKNPPPLPVPEDGKADTKGDTKEAAPPKPEEVDPFKPPKNRITDGKKTVLLEADGTCVSQVDKKCAPGKHCNPPPPEKIKCPKELQLPRAPKKAEVYRRRDRTCWQKGEAKCDEGEDCPPPPSTRVICPVGLAVPK